MQMNGDEERERERLRSVASRLKWRTSGYERERVSETLQITWLFGYSDHFHQVDHDAQV